MALQDLLPAKVPGMLPVDPGAPPMMGGPSMSNPAALLGQLAPPPMPNATFNDRMDSQAADPFTRRTANLNADIYRRENPIAPTTAMGKIGRVFGGIGNALGDLAAPEIMAMTPGTDMNNLRMISRDKGDLDQQSQLQTAQGLRAQTQANTDYLQQKPEIERARVLQKLTSSLAPKGIIATMNPDGTIDTQDDPDSQAYKNQQALQTLHQATADKDNITSEIAQNHYVPGTPEYAEAQRKLSQVDARLHVALAGLGLRAQSLDLRRTNQAAQNTGIDPTTGKPFAGAAQIADANGNITPIGSRFAAGATAAQGGAAQYNDVHGALDSVEDAAAKLAAKNNGDLNTPGVIAALSAAHNPNGGWVTGGISNYLKGTNAAALTPEEMNYVQSIQAAHQNLQGHRKSAGGGTTDSQVDRLEAMIPDATTPNFTYLKGQTGQIRATADRLAPGVASVAGGLAVRGKGAPTATPPQEKPVYVDGQLKGYTTDGKTFSRKL